MCNAILWYFSLKEWKWLKFLIFFFFLRRRENAAVWKVVFGISNLDHPSGFMQTRLVKTIILHPRYNRAVVDYDISIVELDEDINETSYVRPVCLPSKDQLVRPDTYCYITGWGHMGNKSKKDEYFWDSWKNMLTFYWVDQICEPITKLYPCILLLNLIKS